MKQEDRNLLEKRIDEGLKSVILMTYNTVEGFKPGLVEDGRLLIYCWDKREDSIDGCNSAVKSITNKFYEDFNLRQDGQLFEHIFVYAGLNAIDEAIRSARMIGHDWKNPDLTDNQKNVTLVACHCDYEKKRRVAHDSYSVNLIQCECGGDRTLGKIANQIISGVNPKDIKDYGN